MGKELYIQSIEQTDFSLSFFVFFSSFKKEIVLSDEQKNPNLLRNFDEMFEVDLPLEMATMNWNSQVLSSFF